MQHEENGLGWVKGHDQFIKHLMENNAMKDYEVTILGTFRKTISVTALNEDEAEMAVYDHPWTVDADDILNFEIEDVYQE